MTNSLATIALDKEKLLEFSIEIQGISEESINSVNFVIKNDKFNISIPCTYVESKLSVPIPVLLGILNTGVYSFKLEFIVANNYYVGYEDTIEFTTPIKVNKMELTEPEVVTPSFETQLVQQTEELVAPSIKVLVTEKPITESVQPSIPKRFSTASSLINKSRNKQR